MKKVLSLLFVMSVSLSAFSQHTDTPTMYDVQIHCDSAKYILVPTTNLYTFLKLDTSTGIIKQVHFAISADSFAGELPLNDFPLVFDDEKTNGRFQLYPTKNMYNFLLLDRIDGRMWQVQWSFDANSRGILRLRNPQK